VLGHTKVKIFHFDNNLLSQSFGWETKPNISKEINIKQATEYKTQI